MDAVSKDCVLAKSKCLSRTEVLDERGKVKARRAGKSRFGTTALTFEPLLTPHRRRKDHCFTN